MDNLQWRIKTKKMENVIANKSYSFSIRIIKLYKFPSEQKKEFILSKQLLRSGTAIGALVKRSGTCTIKGNFLNKMNVLLNEANEKEYWLMLLKDSAYIGTKEFDSIPIDCSEVPGILISTLKSTKTFNS